MAAGSGFEVQAEAIGWLMEHVKPLPDALDALAGDPDRIDAYAQTGNNVSGR